MSEYDLNRVLFDTAGRHQIVDTITDEATLAAYDLSPAEREALKAGDLTQLYELGANPYLIRRVFRYRFNI